MTVRLNLGSGGRADAGWIHVDKAFGDDTAAAIRKNECARMLRWDLTDLPLPYKDNSVAMAVAHHSLDLLDAKECEALIADVFRVLQPGRTFRISLFDILKATEARDRADRAWFRERFAMHPDLDDALTYMVRLDGARKWVTTPALFCGLLEEAGFIAHEVGFHETTCDNQDSIMDLDSRPDESLWVEGTKPRE